MAAFDENRTQSDRSLFSMLVDAAVSKPERHQQVFAQVPVTGDLLKALEILKGEFGEVRWQALEDAQQLERLEQIQTRLRDVTSSAGRLAVNALQWGLQNRKHRRPQVGSSHVTANVDELELEKLLEG